MCKSVVQRTLESSGLGGEAQERGVRSYLHLGGPGTRFWASQSITLIPGEHSGVAEAGSPPVLPWGPLHRAAHRWEPQHQLAPLQQRTEQSRTGLSLPWETCLHYH